MDWHRISGNWAWWRERIQERWGRLTNEHLDLIAGRRDPLAARIQEIYGLSPAEADRQLRNWERNLAIDDFDEASGMNGRG